MPRLVEQSSTKATSAVDPDPSRYTLVGLFTEIAVYMQILAWLAVVWSETFLFVRCMCLYIFFLQLFCTAHCALDLARDHAP